MEVLEKDFPKLYVVAYETSEHGIEQLLVLTNSHSFNEFVFNDECETYDAAIRNLVVRSLKCKMRFLLVAYWQQLNRNLRRVKQVLSRSLVNKDGNSKLLPKNFITMASYGMHSSMVLFLLLFASVCQRKLL